MKNKLYTLLRVKSDYGLDSVERILYWVVSDVSQEDYIKSLIDLRDGEFLYEGDRHKPIYYRTHYLTHKGNAYLNKVKRSYLKESWLKHRWKILAFAVSTTIGLTGLILQFLNQ